MTLQENMEHILGHAAHTDLQKGMRVLQYIATVVMVKKGSGVKKQFDIILVLVY